MDLPVICTLSGAELQKRRREILNSFPTARIKTIELPNGYAYEFPFDSEITMKLAHLVCLEHECCRCLTFRISLEAGNGPLTLEITGPSEAKPVIAGFFGGWYTPHHSDHSFNNSPNALRSKIANETSVSS